MCSISTEGFNVDVKLLSKGGLFYPSPVDNIPSTNFKYPLCACNTKGSPFASEV